MTTTNLPPARPDEPEQHDATGNPSRDDLRRYRDNLQGEVDGVAVYRAMAEGEESAALKELYLRLAETEARHGELWAKRLEAAGHDPARIRPSWRARVLALLARRLGAGLVAPTIAEQEGKAQKQYDDQPEAGGTTLAADERSHARLLGELAGSRGVTGAELARVEGRHRGTGGNTLRAAVLGANDGLLSNTSLIMGVAGAAIGNAAIVAAGLAGLLAGAFSMALGEWLSVQSARELFAHQLEVEKAEIEADPEEEAIELALIYQSKGVSAEHAKELAAQIIGGERTSALDTLAREELGIDPEELGGSAYHAAFTSFALFAMGAIVPLVPFVVASGTPALVAAIVASGLGLFLIGAAITVVTGQNALKSGLRTLVLGLAAAAATYAIGSLVGTKI